MLHPLGSRSLTRQYAATARPLKGKIAKGFSGMRDPGGSGGGTVVPGQRIGKKAKHAKHLTSARAVEAAAFDRRLLLHTVPDTHSAPHTQCLKSDRRPGYRAHAARPAKMQSKAATSLVFRSQRCRLCCSTGRLSSFC